MEGLIFEIIFIILVTVIILLLQSFYVNNFFLAGVIMIQDNNFKYTCSTTLPLMVGNEYIKVMVEERLGAVDLLFSQLGISEARTYPTAQYLSDKSYELFPLLAGRMGFRVTVGDVEETAGAFSEGFTVCRFPLHGIEDTGVVELSFNLRGSGVSV